MCHDPYFVVECTALKLTSYVWRNKTQNDQFASNNILCHFQFSLTFFIKFVGGKSSWNRKQRNMLKVKFNQLKHNCFFSSPVASDIDCTLQSLQLLKKLKIYKNYKDDTYLLVSLDDIVVT